MASVDIWRVEDKYGDGPFAGGNGLGPWLALRPDLAAPPGLVAYAFRGYESMPVYLDPDWHISPHQEGYPLDGVCGSPGWVCGAEDSAQLAQWFPDDWIRLALHANGYGLARFSVPLGLIRFGRRQVMFQRPETPVEYFSTLEW